MNHRKDGPKTLEPSLFVLSNQHLSGGAIRFEDVKALVGSGDTNTVDLIIGGMAVVGTIDETNVTGIVAGVVKPSFLVVRRIGRVDILLTKGIPILGSGNSELVMKPS